MATNITGTPNIVQLPPVSTVIMPTTYTVVGSPTPNTAVGALTDASDTTYVQEQLSGVNHYMWFKCGSTQMPTKSRVVYARAVARAYRTSGAPKRSWILQLADNTTKALLMGNGPVTKSTLGTSVGQYSTATQTTLSDNKTLIDQNQISRGLCFVTGVSGTPSDALSYRTTQGYVELSYDQPPTATVTTSGTFNDTSSPLITWDYFDDLQPQAAYTVTVTNSGGSTVYASGKVTSSNTFHQLPISLANGTYTVAVRVNQAWKGSGGDFPSLGPATSSFTIAVLPLPTPVLLATTRPINANYLSGNTASFDTGNGNWTAFSGSIAWSSTGGVSNKGAMSLAPGSTAQVSYDLSTLSVQSPLQFGLTARLANTGYNPADMVVSFTYQDASLAFLSSASVVTYAADPINAGFTRLTVSDSSLQPATARYVKISIQNLNATYTMTADDARLSTYNRDAGLAAKTLNDSDQFATALFVNNHINLLNFDDSSFDNGSAGWQGLTNASVTTVTTPVVDGQRALKVTVPAAGASVVGQYAAATAWPKGLTNFGVSAQVSGPAVFAAKSVQITAVFYDANFALISNSAYSSAASAPYSFYRATGPVPANTVYVSVQVAITGCAAGDIWYVDDVMLSDYVDVNVPWSRGGVITNTVNQLTYDDSTIGPAQNWVAGTTNTAVAASTDQARQGATSLKVTQLATGTPSVDVILGNGVYFPIDTTLGYVHRLAVYSPVSARTVSGRVNLYDANFAYVTTIATGSFTSTVGAWREGTTLIPISTWAANPTAAYIGLENFINGAAQNEVHYLDTFGLYGLTAGQYANVSSLGWQPGQYPNTDAAPTMHVDWTEDGTNYSTLADVPLLDANGVFNPIIELVDYEIKSGTTRTYRANVAKQQNGTQLVSGRGSASASLTLSNVWMHAQANPGATLTHYVFDGAGRQEDLQAISASTVLQGRAYPFAEYSTQLAASLQVQLAISSPADKAAMDTLAQNAGNVVLRDQRGRRYIGSIGSVSYTDTPFGSTVAFTITQAGV